MTAAALALVPDDTVVETDQIQVGDIDTNTHTDVEALCLCALLWAPYEAAARAVAALEVEDFERPIHRELFTVIARLVRAGKPHDTTMVAAELERTGNLAGHHGAERSRYLANITTRGADRIAVDHYTRTVVSQAYRRSFRAAAQSLAQAAEQLPEDQLFEHMVALGRQQRAATNRLNHLRGEGQ
ncbi:DnaB-like helicase N-terminal domain-containing protein [Rhodococcus opacus]|uniref:DnaB-like helicase N-terminal domain-containing protein n=1 Tax=Rhodococcus opacus TaxID=37919 RepID=A0AAX3YRR0_RHOOP|nr:DnaB-like helicase N-terminal domain-containing protein [Rhodococcus opacus]WLF51550.1 DnaB-like helicase N-terminal domain-containing protein [Rhodococcus opacus]